jgi:ATP-dependent Lhr-like helicase
VSFAGLHDAVVAALRERGFAELTEPQKKAIPLILEGHNVLIIAPTGSGKTEAALLPIFSKFLELGARDPGIYILYITPLRALNRDLLDRLKWWGAKLGIAVDVRHGDTDAADRSRQSRNPPHMLITTPEMLQAILTGKRLLEHLKQLRWVVVDEVHELAEDKRGVQLGVTLERLRYHVGRDLQVVGLSATVGSPDEVAKFLFGVGRPYKIVQVNIIRRMRLEVLRPAPGEGDKELAQRLSTHDDAAARLRSIKDLVESHRTTLIFVNTRSMAELLGFRLGQAYPDLPISVHHSSLSKMVRLTVEGKLKSGELKAVVATSSLELGIDIGHVDLVIQYLSPHQVVRLVQRVGRSGHRLTMTPKGVIIADDVNDVLESLEIVRRAKSGLLERTKVPYKPYDVLANQIAAFLMLKPRWRLAELYEVIKRAYPYRDLTLEELKRVVKFMGELRPRLALYFEEDDMVVRPRNRGFFRYFFETLSMIPDERQYAVVDSKTGELIGTLDEAFVAEYGTPGVKFVFRGRPWLITAVDGRAIKVVEVDDPSGAIPSWIGEEIPVPFEVAQGVGELKRVVRGLDRGSAVKALEELGASEELAEFIVDEVHRQPPDLTPDDKTILVEQYTDNIVIVHAHLGTLANRTLAKLLGEAMIRDLEVPVGFHQDPYAIILQSSKPLSARQVAAALARLAELQPVELAELVKSALIKSGSFKRRFLYVAKRFGAIDKEADVYSVSIGKLVEAFSGTPVFDEALREALEQDLDLDSTWAILQGIKRGEIAVKVSDGPTYMGKVVYEKLAHRLEIIPPERLRRLVLDSAKARLLNTSMLFVCASCGWTGLVRVGEVYEIKCPRCGGSDIGVIRHIATDNLEREVRRKAEEAAETREILRRYGWKGLYALASRIPTEDIQGVLAKADGADLNKLTELILEAEKEHLKAKLLEEP